MYFSRRSFLKLGLAGAAASCLPRFASAQHSGHIASTPNLEPFVDPLPIPAILKPKVVGGKDVYTITMKEASVKVHRDLPSTNVVGYNGLFPGPTIAAKKNRAVRITHVNQLPAMFGSHEMGEHMPAVHLHGALVTPDSDGHPMDGIPDGQSREYNYPNRQRGCALWYHDHMHGSTGHNVYMGLAGLYFLEDVKERALKLPRGACEVPLVLQDRSFDSSGQLVYTLDATSLETGVHGDVVLVNGKIQPYFEVAARKYRLRILNGSNARIYRIALTGGLPLVQIGTDGGLMQRPMVKQSITIAPSERVDLIVDFAGQTPGSSVLLQNLDGEMRTISLLQFRVNKQQKENAVIPPFLSAWQDLPAPSLKREFTLNRKILDGALTWVINGFGYDSPERPAQIPKPKLDSVEHWRFINPTNHPHPMHLHLVQFQIVNINGEPQEPADHGWKDTIVVPPGGEVTIAVQFSGYLGKYVFHCHNLEHEDFAMMSEFEVVA